VVEDEIDLIQAHGGYAPSPVMLYEEDYSQYVPRGHYTTSEKLKNYFRAMMWFGRMSFLLKGSDEVGRGETCSQCEALISPYDARIQTMGAAVMAGLLGQHESLLELWEKAYKVTSFFAGFSDDLGPYEYLEAIDHVLTGDWQRELAGEEACDRLKTRLAEYGSPLIYGGTGDCALVPPFTPEQADECLAKTRGFRLMGQRFVPDSYVLSKMVAPYTGEFTGTGMPFTAYNVPGVGIARVFPRGLDFMAVLGSTRALEVLDRLGDSQYRNYDKALADVAAEVAEIPEQDWNQNLYWNWLWVLKALVDQHGGNRPTFMGTDAWEDRLLAQALASWAELRHDTILYVKQSYTMTLTAAPLPLGGEGFVEPVPEVYNRLLSLTRMMRLGLEAMGLAETRRDNLVRLEEVLGRLVSISLKELRGEDLSDYDLMEIRSFWSVLEGVVSGLDDKAKKTTIVADVHTDSNSGMVLEEGVGYVAVIVVAWNTGNGISLAAGPELTYHEFKQPMAERLTDEAWRDLLATDPPPPPSGSGLAF
jgi:hypothetical protein